MLKDERQNITLRSRLLDVLNPQAALARGYAIMRSHDRVVRSGAAVQQGQRVVIDLADAQIAATIDSVTLKEL